jgi:hypothetical protein
VSLQCLTFFVSHYVLLQINFYITYFNFSLYFSLNPIIAKKKKLKYNLEIEESTLIDILNNIYIYIYIYIYI